MDYEKEYKEALERAKYLKENTDSVGALDISACFGQIFKELRESEDERIRKALIELSEKVAQRQFFINRNTTLKDVLDWLEKQGEKTEPIEGFNTEFERQISHLIASTINKEYDYTKDFVKWTSGTLLNYAKHELEKQGRQKSQCKSAFELWKDMRFEVYQQASGNRHEPNCSDDSTKMFSLNDIDEIFEKVAEKQGEQKVINEYNEHEPTSYEIEKWNEAYEKGYDIGYMNGKNEQKPTDAIAEMKQVEWSEEDEKMCQETIDWFEKKCFPYALESENPARESIKWLKSLKGHVQPQPKQVWSEEDEKLYISALWHIKNSCGNGGKDSGEYEVYNWLKSLKDRVQPKQELNEEDEKILNKIIDELTPYGECPDYPSPEEQEYYYTRQEMIDWLQSLKEKIHPNKE